MNNQLGMQMLFNVIGGLGFFLLGMRNLSDGLQALGSNRLRRMISMATNNRFMAIGVGCLVTCLIQSSSITTVMVVGFVNSTVMTLTQGIGVIMGANIGTTITGWILVLNIGIYGLPLLGVSALVYLFSSRDRIRYTALAFMGLGLIFFGLEMMKNGFKPIRSMPEFERWFHLFTADSYWGMWKCVLVGCVLTCIVQSSSATLGITISLAATGVIDFETAAALVLGENIGTTITAYLAGLGATTNAKRASYAHMVFNFLGVLWITSIFPWYIDLVRSIVSADPEAIVLVNGVETFPNITRSIAIVHSVFNIANTILFVPFIGLMAKILQLLVREQTREIPHLTSLDRHLLDAPAMGVEQSYMEVLRMSEITADMLGELRQAIDADDPNSKSVKKVFDGEEELDNMQKEVVTFLNELLSGNISHEVMHESRKQLRMADEYESLGDYIANILKFHLKLREHEHRFTDEGEKELRDLHQDVVAFFQVIKHACELRRPELVSKAHIQGDAITHKVRRLRDNHLKRVSEYGIKPLATVLFTDTINAYRRVKDHLLNIAEALGGEK